MEKVREFQGILLRYFKFGNSEDEAKLIVQLMKKKGWNDFNKVNFNDSSKEFIRKIRDEFEKDNSK